jgi:hypothetical protein
MEVKVLETCHARICKTGTYSDIGVKVNVMRISTSLKQKDL